MKGMEGMEGMDEESPAKAKQKVKTECGELKGGKPDDPLIQALQQKCAEEKTSTPSGKSGHSAHEHTEPATGTPPGDEHKASGEHHHQH